MSHDLRSPRTSDGGQASTALAASDARLDDPDVERCLDLLRRIWPSARGTASSAQPTVTCSTDDGTATVAGTTWGRFVVQRQIGHGSYGIVLLATDQVMKREVALKIPQPHILADGHGLMRFLREAEAAAILTHPNIVPVHEVGEEQGVPYIVSAYCRGPSLATWLAEQQQPIAPLQAALLVESLAGALDYAHSRGVLHRDLKPANILLDEAPLAAAGELPLVPKLTDFGLAKIAGVAATETCEGTLVGTFQYMAPEQAAGRPQDIGVRTDIWALGTILYESLAGEKAFPGEDASVLARIQAAEPRSLRSRGLGIPLDLINICQRCLQKEPTDRYATANELLLDLQRFRRGEPVLARPLNPVVRSLRWMRRRPAISALLLTVMLSAIGGATGVAWQWHRANLNAAAASAAAQRARASLNEAEESLWDFAWLVQEYSLYRRSEDPVPTALWSRLDIAAEPYATAPESDRVQRPIRAARYFCRGAQLITLAHFPEAEAEFGKAANSWREVLRELPNRPSYRRSLALTLYCQGFCCEQYAGRDVAQACYSEARHVFTADAANPEANAILEYAAVVETIGKSFALRNRRVEAKRAYEEAFEAAAEAAERAPELEEAQYHMARYTADVARTEVEFRIPDTPLEKFASAARILRKLNANSPGEERYCVLSTEVALERAGRLQRLGRSNEAQPIYLKAIADAEKSLATFADRPAWLRRLALGHSEFASCQVKSKHPDLAVKNWEASNHYWRAIDLDKQLCDQDRVAWAVVSYQLAMRYQQEGRPTDAARHAQQGLDLLIRAQATIRESRQARLAREGCERLLANQESDPSSLLQTTPATR